MTGGKGARSALPSRDECIAMLVESGCNQQVIEHCMAVADLAVRVAKKAGAKVDLVEAGALLHDIGRCRSHGLDHAVVGVEVAERLRLPAAIVKIIERHIGGGLTRAEAKALGLPEKDYIPKTLEEKIVAHADKLLSGTRRTTVKAAVGYFVRRGFHDSALRILKLHEELSAICGINIDDI